MKRFADTRALLKDFMRSEDPVSTLMEHLRQVASEVGQQREHPADVERGDDTLRPLLVGYTGAGNTGADVRVVEILRQLRAIFPRAALDPGLMFLGHEASELFGPVRRLRLQGYFPEFLRQQGRLHDAVIVCEGSMFTSTFSDLLSAVFAGSLGYAARRGMPAIGYGADVGVMTDVLGEFVEDLCKGALIQCRNSTAKRRLDKLNLRTAHGADPAWTFEPKDADARRALAVAGWDGRQRIAAFCPVNPFWWPVTVDLKKLAALRTDRKLRELHYGGMLFHSWSPDAERRYQRYLDGLAHCADSLRMQHYFVVVIGMEKLDARCCGDLLSRTKASPPLFVSGDFGMSAIAGILRRASIVVTSRFHAAVLAISGLRPTIGVPIDNRITDLFCESGLQECLVPCDAEDLAARLDEKVEYALQACESLGRSYAELRAVEIKKLGNMGMDLYEELSSKSHKYAQPRPGAHWFNYLPPLSKTVADSVIAIADSTL